MNAQNSPRNRILIPLVDQARLPDQFLAVQNALRAQDAPRLREAAHKLSGILAAFSTEAGAVASNLEDQAAGGRLTPDQVKKVLVQTARPMTKNDGSPYALWEVGAGYLDAYAAVLAVMP